MLLKDQSFMIWLSATENGHLEILAQEPLRLELRISSLHQRLFSLVSSSLALNISLTIYTYFNGTWSSLMDFFHPWDGIALVVFWTTWRVGSYTFTGWRNVCIHVSPWGECLWNIRRRRWFSTPRYSATGAPALQASARQQQRWPGSFQSHWTELRDLKLSVLNLFSYKLTNQK